MINQAAPIDEPADGGRRAQIVDAALHVMAEHGFRGASIKRIAQRAGLKSPALIYWYFRDKQALFETVLPLVVASFLQGAQQPETGRMMRLLLSEVVRHPQVATFFAERGPLVVLGFLERYLTRQMELGRLRHHDPRAGARALMGMLLVYALG